MSAVKDNRNPLTDPIAGDVVEKIAVNGWTIRRTVTSVICGRDIVYASSVAGGPAVCRKQCFISTWRAWCAKATVVKKAQG